MNIRELTVAEHRASDARRMTTMFSPNSQRMMNVERLVAETEA